MGYAKYHEDDFGFVCERLYSNAITSEKSKKEFIKMKNYFLKLKNLLRMKLLVLLQLKMMI